MSIKFLTSREVAKYLSVSESTLCRWRASGTGPQFRKLNGIYRYLQSELDSWLESKVVP